MSTSPAPTRSLRELAEHLGLPVPAHDLEITGLATIEDAGPGHLTFLANDRYAPKLKESKAGAALVPADFDGEAPMPMIKTEHPRIAFALLLDLFHPERKHAPGIHPTAVIPESCTLGEDVSIGAYVVLGENVQVGARTRLHPHVVIYDDVRIGDDCELHSHVSVRRGSTLGRRVVLHNGAVIGADGFGFEPDAEGRLHKVPQVGIAEIHDDAEIQALAAVDRAAMGATVVGEGTKIDNLAQIGHGCVIGKHSVICGQVGLAGSTKVGNHVMLGGQAGSAGHITIGDFTQAAAKSGILGDVEPGSKIGGQPAIPIGEILRASIVIPQLPDMLRRLKKLERQAAAAQDDA